jgi:hypothetical protein
MKMIDDIGGVEPKVAFDCDGVLANFSRGFVRIAHQLFGTPVGDYSSQQCWMFEDFPELGLDKDKCKAVWKVITESKYFWTSLDPLNPSIMQTINNIENKVFITNRPGVDTQKQTEWFLERWGIYQPRVIVAEQKGPVVLKENVVAILDDYIKNVTEIRAAAPSCYTALLYTPYNKVYHNEWRGKTADYQSPSFWRKVHASLAGFPATPIMNIAYKYPDAPIVLSVDHFINECESRGLIKWQDTNQKSSFPFIT